MNTLIQDGLQAVEAKLRAATDSHVPLLQDTTAHTISAGGKRLRPQIALLAYLAAGGHDLAQVVPVAAAVELVHTATLVHDDINDHSLTRRGKATIHARWGRTFALLTGDFLFARVYEMMAPYGADFNVIMSTACVKLVEGETLQAAAAKAGQMDRETYKQIIALKTASLFEAAAQMGGMLGGAPPATVEALRRYGYHLGLAFQIVDDVLDIVGDAAAMGKPTGIDVAHGMGAFVAQNGHSQTAAPAAVAVADDPIQTMMARLRSSGAVEVARLQAREMAQRARAALADIPPSLAREELDHLVTLVMDRDR